MEVITYNPPPFRRDYATDIYHRQQILDNLTYTENFTAPKMEKKKIFVESEKHANTSFIHFTGVNL